MEMASILAGQISLLNDLLIMLDFFDNISTIILLVLAFAVFRRDVVPCPCFVCDCSLV